MVLAFGVQVFRLVLIVLKARDRPNAVNARAETIDHRHTILTDQALPHLVPATDGAELAYTLVVRPLPKHPVRRRSHALSDRRPAILGKCAWIKYPIAKLVVALTVLDALRHLFGCQLKASVRLAIRNVPFAVAY